MPAVIAMLVVALFEEQLRRALTISEGDFPILVSGPITIVLWSAVALTLFLPPLPAMLRRRRHAAAPGRFRTASG